MVTGFIGEQVQSGNLHKLQGLKNGSFVDWAYGATRYRESIAADCRTYKFVEYASGTMDGLVLKIDLGLKEGSN